MKLRTAIILNFPEELLSHQMRTKKKERKKEKHSICSIKQPVATFV